MPVINISNGRIINISTERENTFVTVTYRDNSENRQNEQTVVLVVGPRTIILNSNGNLVSASALRVGMTINATISSAMTRSNPPQSNAYLIVTIRQFGQGPGPKPPEPRPPRPQTPRPQPPRPQPQPRPEDVTVGNIINVERNNRSFTTISDRDFSSIIRFNVPENTPIFDRAGRPINFSRLTPGMRVRVRHANFMTASIPPQTTAFEISVL